MALKFTKQISEDECIGDSLDTINASFSALDEGLQDVQDVVNNVEGAVENVLAQGNFVGGWINAPTVTNDNLNYFLKYVGGTTPYKWQQDNVLISTGGKIGIGTNNPVRLLHINGDATSDPGLRIDSGANYAGAEVRGLSGGFIRLTRKGTGRPYLVELTSSLSGVNLSDGMGVGGSINVLGDYFDIKTGTTVSNLSSLMFVTPNQGGRLGISGVINPLAKLDIGSNSSTGEGAEVRLRGSNSSSYDFGLATTNTEFKIIRYPKGSTAGGTNLFVADTSGQITAPSLIASNVYVNQSGTSYGSLFVGRQDSSLEGGEIKLAEANNNTAHFFMDVYGTTSTGTAYPVFRIHRNDGSTPALFITNDKRVGILKMPETGLSLDVAGEFRSNGLYTDTTQGGQTIFYRGSNFIRFNSDSSYANIEIGGPNGGYIDLKSPETDDYDLRLWHSTNSTSIISKSNLTISSVGTLGLSSTGGSTIGGGLTVGGDLTVDNITATNLSTLGGNLTVNTIKVNNLSAANFQISGITNEFLNTTMLRAEGAKTNILFLSASTPSTNDFGINLNSIASTYLNNTYIMFAPMGSINDWAFLRQIGGNDNFHLALDFHDNLAGSTGQAFSIRNISNNTAQSLFHLATDGNVGIGNSAPLAKLEINQNSNTQPGLKVSNQGSANALEVVGTASATTINTTTINTTTTNTGDLNATTQTITPVIRNSNSSTAINLNNGGLQFRVNNSVIAECTSSLFSATTLTVNTINSTNHVGDSLSINSISKNGGGNISVFNDLNIKSITTEGFVRVSTAAENHLVMTANQINSGFYSSTENIQLALNYTTTTTNGNFRNLIVYDGKRQPIIEATGSTKTVRFKGPVVFEAGISGIVFPTVDFTPINQKNVEQDNRITTLESRPIFDINPINQKNAEQDAKNVEQDTRLTNLETKTTNLYFSSKLKPDKGGIQIISFYYNSATIKFGENLADQWHSLKYLLSFANGEGKKLWSDYFTTSSIKRLKLAIHANETTVSLADELTPNMTTAVPNLTSFNASNAKSDFAFITSNNKLYKEVASVVAGNNVAKYLYVSLDLDKDNDALLKFVRNDKPTFWFSVYLLDGF